MDTGPKVLSVSSLQKIIAQVPNNNH